MLPFDTHGTLESDTRRKLRTAHPYLFDLMPPYTGCWHDVFEALCLIECLLV